MKRTDANLGVSGFLLSEKSNTWKNINNSFVLELERSVATLNIVSMVELNSQVLCCSGGTLWVSHHTSAVTCDLDA